jgi:Cytochrome P460
MTARAVPPAESSSHTSRPVSHIAYVSGVPGRETYPGYAGSAQNVQFMLKDSKKYAASGGWGFGQFTDRKPDDEALHKTCFPCHQPAKGHELIFTRYAPSP